MAEYVDFYAYFAIIWAYFARLGAPWLMFVLFVAKSSKGILFPLAESMAQCGLNM